jgi:SNF2 family DNA or RNA helicase
MIPRPYQVKGAEFLKSHKRAGLTDDPGLGKTLQAILAAETPVIVASPTYLVEQWKDAILEQYPDANVGMALGTINQRYKVIQSKPDWLCLNIEMLRGYDLYYPNTFIVDEAHHIRNRGAQQSKGAKQLALNVPLVYMLTATPIVKEVDDIWHLLHILDYKAFKSYATFIRMFCITSDGPFGPVVVGPKHPQALKAVLSKYFLGRTYKEVGLYLPDLIETVIKIQETKTFYKDYNDTKNNYSFGPFNFDNALATIIFLRQMVRTRTKIHTVVDMLDDMPGNTVVFTWFKDSAFELANYIRCPAITGELPPIERKRIAGEHHPTITATIPSLSEGVDLSYARNVVFFEEDYTPGVMHQALSRVRRYSSNTDPVRVYYIQVKSTVDEVIHRMVQRRISNIREIYSEAMK